ncbi:hypothetical protein EV385_0904 [Krasilnikovia cinnamomea]|uniref:Lipoprotein n=1 Tax=Krasilnikovia cinnamomea TaxID=349313 RepID=A0A4Q7ZER4_9ACTN|nr:hypothetical protein [Krasilnikovia cinnamomea]RZU49168.1 hypothetical protein EV385_0904 [Krasilnikovia cinnamomea]
MKSTRTRWLYAGGSAVACAAVIAVGTVAANAGMTGRTGGAAAGAGAAPAAPVPSTSAATRRPDPSPPKPEPIGAVIDSGIAAREGSWVFYGVPVAEPALPKVRFGVMAGRRLPGGTLTADVMTNEVTGSDRAPGFHAVQAGMGIEAGQSPTFGYYAGPAARITGRANGRTVTAHQARWSEDRSVVVFWFDPAVKGIGKLAAYDQGGRKLPTGNAGVGVG